MMRTALSLAIVLVVVAACTSVRPVAIKAGDVCENCRQTILDPRVAAEIVQPSGLALKFKTVTCMARYMNQHQTGGSPVYVTDYPTGRLIPAQRAVFVRAEIDQNTRALDYVAFGDLRAAVEFGREQRSSPVDWPAIRQRAGAGN